MLKCTKVRKSWHIDTVSVTLYAIWDARAGVSLAHTEKRSLGPLWGLWERFCRVGGVTGGKGSGWGCAQRAPPARRRGKM